MDIANASLLDEATAAAEAMVMMANLRSRKMVKADVNTILVDDKMWPQTHDVLKTRALPLGFELKIQPKDEFDYDENVFGVIVQYPNSDGEITDYAELVEKAHEKEIKVAVAADLMSLAILTPPGEWGADIVFGNSQRFGGANGIWRTTCRIFCSPRSFQTKHAGTYYWCNQRYAW